MLAKLNHSGQVLILLLIVILVNSLRAFDDDEDLYDEHHHESSSETDKPGPKDRVLLKDIQVLTFERNKRTSSRRTHSIHQLSCVGGTAGCKLFTPNLVECKNEGWNNELKKFSWNCHADMSDRVRFNHVEIICEGYDYPEDDYILVGSCGLEFTLDYTDPHDYHHHSYFKHMDEHEKELHHERVRERLRTTSTPTTPTTTTTTTTDTKKKDSPKFNLLRRVTDHLFLIGAFLLLCLCSSILVRYFGSHYNNNQINKRKKPIRNYGPLTSAVMTTKKAC